jgi:hypothetical protein
LRRGLSLEAQWHAALMLCAQRDHLFLRFSAAERAPCYRWALGRT